MRGEMVAKGHMPTLEHYDPIAMAEPVLSPKPPARQPRHPHTKNTTEFFLPPHPVPPDTVPRTHHLILTIILSTPSNNALTSSAALATIAPSTTL